MSICVFALCTKTHIRHELFAGNTDFLRQCGVEHHDLLVMGSRAEYFLDIPVHDVYEGLSKKRKSKIHQGGSIKPTKLLQHFVPLVQSEVFDILGIQNLFSTEGIQATRSHHDKVWALILVTKNFRVLLYRSITIEDVDPYVRYVLCKPHVLVLDLKGEFTGVAQDRKPRHSQAPIAVMLQV